MWRKIIILLTANSKERGSLTSRTRDMRNREMLKCEIAKRFLVQLVVTWGEEASGAKFFHSFGDCDLECRDSSPQEFRNAEIPKCEMAKSTRDPVLVIQRCWILGNLIEGLLLLFMINCSIMIQLAKPNHGFWMVGDLVAEAFFPKKIRGVTKEVVNKRNMLWLCACSGEEWKMNWTVER